MRHRDNKKYRQRVHAKRGAAERYGLELHDHELDALIAQIKANKAKFVCRESHRVTRWIVKHGGLELACIYDTTRQEIVTFLKMEWIDDEPEQLQSRF